MAHKYTLFIDESGDTGITKVREGIESKGASPLLVIAGCLVPQIRETALLELLAEISRDVRKSDLHCSGMKHLQVAKYAREVGLKAQIKCFAFVSTKSTIGGFKEQIAGKGQDQRYYNKCVSYFLERVGHFMRLKGISGEDLDIVFERREGHDYEKLRNYIRIIQKNPIDPRLEFYLQPIVPGRIVSVPKEVNKLLCYADLISFAVAAALNPSASNFGIPEQRYLRELKELFFKDDKSGAIGEFGLKLFKRFDLKFDKTTARFVDKWHVSGAFPDLHDGGSH